MLGGLGIGLPPPQGLWYPLPTNQVYQPLGSEFEVAGGAALYVPSGWWLVRTGQYTQIQWLDPVTGTQWVPITTVGQCLYYVNSDGSNIRIFNPTGTPVGALVTNVGSGYVQATTVVTPNAGNSVWRAIVGGALTALTVGNDPNGVAGGTNFSIPPIVDIPPPPAGGVQATANATLTAGAVTALTLVNQGAGYLAAPTPILRPNPFDPNIGLITVPAVTSTVGGAGQIAAILCTNNGQLLTTAQIGAFALTIAGAGTAATATPIVCQTVTGVAFSGGGGAGYAGAAVTVTALPSAAIGVPGAIVNPAISSKLFIPGGAIITAPVAGGVIGTAFISDGGLFMATPAAIVGAAQGTTNPTTASTPTLTMGSSTDTVFLQALGGAF